MLELPDGTILHESKVLMDYCEEAYPRQGYSTLPEDPVQRAHLRLGMNILDQLQSAYYPFYSKRLNYEESDVKNLKEKLLRIEDYLKTHQNASGFAFGTENPTQLDIHFYPLLSRVHYMKDSAFNGLYEQLNFEAECPHILKFLEAVRAREEFKPILSQKIPQQHLIKELTELPADKRIMLTLPVKFE